MKELLDKGADPNARLARKIWFTRYNFDLLRVDEAGATPFWRAAYASDIAAMKLLVAHGADPTIADDEAAGGRAAGRRPRRAGDGRLGPAAAADRRARHRRRCSPPPAPATAKASPATRTASRRPACCRR